MLTLFIIGFILSAIAIISGIIAVSCMNSFKYHDPTYNIFAGIMVFTIVWWIVIIIIGINYANRHQLKSVHYKIDWPEEMPGINASAASPDTVLMFKDSTDSIRVWYYHSK